MNKINFFKKALFAVSIFFIFASCKTIPAKPLAVLVEHPERFFWEIKTDTASVFVLGTIHASDNTFYPLEENILKNFDTADRLVSELGGQAEIVKATIAVQKRVMENINLDPRKNLANFLSKEDTEFLNKKFGEENIKKLFVFNPWVLTQVINKAAIEESKLEVQAGIDLYLITRAGGKKIEALDPIETQLDIVDSKIFNFEEQMEILKEAIAELKNPKKTTAQYKELKRLYLNNDKQGLSKFVAETMDMPNPLSEEKKKAYKDNIFKNRNIKWAEHFNTYLKSGGKTFVFAGAAHFVGENNVFEIMKKKGLLTGDK